MPRSHAFRADPASREPAFCTPCRICGLTPYEGAHIDECPSCWGRGEESRGKSGHLAYDAQLGGTILEEHDAIETGTHAVHPKVVNGRLTCSRCTRPVPPVWRTGFDGRWRPSGPSAAFH